MLTASVVVHDKDYRVDPNQELFALDAINFAAGLFHGFPISSSASRTAVAATLGSRQRLVSIVASGFVVLTVIALRPALGEIPAERLRR